METVLLCEIASDDNRKYTRDEGFEQLVESIRRYGIIEPPVVRKQEGGGYRVVAGRRRIAALRQAAGKDKKQAVICHVRTEGDTGSDEEIALAENVNRQEMHPLDEAALFGRMAERGMAADEIARYYARSPSAIYKRLRLAGLADGLKGMFRDGWLDIGSAAVLAELPEEDQQDFHGQYGGRERKVEGHEVTAFVAKKQRFRIVGCMGGCAGCAMRTHNQGNELFDEFQHMDDVCLDADCYRRQWKGIIEVAIAEQRGDPTRTDDKVRFAGGIPELLYGRATHAELTFEGSPVRLDVLKDKSHEFTGPSTRRKGCCWEVRERGGTLTVSRVGYKRKEPREARGKGATVSGPDKGETARYGGELLEAAAEGRGKTAAETADALRKKNVGPYEFKNKVRELVCERVVAKRVEAEGMWEAKPKDYLSMFMQAISDNFGSCDDSSFVEERFSARQRRWLEDLLKVKSLKELALPDEAQRLFHFLLLSFGFDDIPDIDELKGIEKSGNIFWEYAFMPASEYRGLCLQAARDVAARELDAKPEKGKKKKGGGAPAKAGERKCRECGCTDGDCTQCIEKTGERCHWVEDDLCSACAQAGADDNYPFEPDLDPGMETEDAG